MNCVNGARCTYGTQMPYLIVFSIQLNMENPSGSQYPGKNNLLEQTKAQVDDVLGIMRVNVEKVLERDHKLSELDNRADALQEGGRRFEQQAQKLKRKYWWKNLKMMIILGVIGLVILIIIIGKKKLCVVFNFITI